MAHSHSRRPHHDDTSLAGGQKCILSSPLLFVITANSTNSLYAPESPLRIDGVPDDATYEIVDSVGPNIGHDRIVGKHTI